MNNEDNQWLEVKFGLLIEDYDKINTNIIQIFQLLYFI